MLHVGFEKPFMLHIDYIRLETPVSHGGFKKPLCCKLILRNPYVSC